MAEAVPFTFAIPAGRMAPFAVVGHFRVRTMEMALGDDHGGGAQLLPAGSRLGRELKRALLRYRVTGRLQINTGVLGISLIAGDAPTSPDQRDYL